jgi:hypothetical protein
VVNVTVVGQKQAMVPDVGDRYSSSMIEEEYTNIAGYIGQ